MDAQGWLKRYKDIEDGKVLPTFLEFFKIAMIFGIAEHVNLKDLYPTIYRDLKLEIEEADKLYQKSKSQKKKRMRKS